MKTLEFTGGEPTIRQDLLELVRFAKKTGFEKISIITNGQRLANPEYCQKLIEAGVTEFLFSIHAAKPEAHDYLTRKPGSFKKLLQAIENTLQSGARVRCNSVVTAENFHDIYKRAQLLKMHQVRTLNFIIFNPLEEAANKDSFIEYSKVAAPLKETIVDFNKDFDKLSIRYIPLCQMKGFENYVQNVHQVNYDQDEWNYYQRAYVREPHSKWHAGVAAGLFLLPDKAHWLSLGWEHSKHAAIMEAHSFLQKKRSEKCKKCAYGFICGGVWKAYYNRFGDHELNNCDEKLILNPWHFMNSAQRGEIFNTTAG
jgi:MoaA/NifB/PqqE/SkfB family radical SAM enzyme